MAKPKTAAPPPDIEVHDEVYFRQGSSALAGKVICHGRHGAHVQVEGHAEPHKVKWEHMLGHKNRVRPSMKVVDQGEDGLLLEGADGRRRYVHDPIYETTMMKALKGGAGLSLQPVTDRAGHATQRWKKTSPDVKKERPQAKPKDAPAQRPGPAPLATSAAGYGKHNLASGDSVHFKAGDFEGKGEIVGEPGEHGAHVRDSSGREHRVLWSEMTGHERPKVGEAKARSKPARPPPAKPNYPARLEGESDKKWLKRIAPDLESPESMPEEHAKFFNMGGATVVPIDKLISSKSDEENAQGGGNSPKFMMAAYHGEVAKRDPIKVTPNGDGTFTVLDGNGTYTGVKGYGWKELPVTIAQPHETEAEVFAAGEEALSQLRDWLDQGVGVASKASLRTMAKAPEDLTPEEWDQPGGMLFVAPLKSREQASEKVQADYDGDWSRLLDVTRCSLAVDTFADLTALTDRLKASGMVVARAKDRFHKPTAAGYRDMVLNVRMPNGHISEVQLHVKPMLQAKGEGHALYKAAQAIARKHDDEPPESWPKADTVAFRKAMDDMQSLYTSAWAKAGGAKKPSL